MLVCLDTETTGLPDWRSPSDAPHQPHLVQLALILMSDDFTEHAHVSLVIKPDGWTIPDEVSAIHGITTAEADRIGVPEKLAARLYASMVYTLGARDANLRFARPKRPQPMSRSCEEWRAIPGYEGLYEVSDHGRVRKLRKRCGSHDTALPKPQPLTLKKTGRYWGVSLCKGNRKRRLYIHRLVAIVFLGGELPPPFEVAHRDGKRDHNDMWNLRWATTASNHADKREHGTLLCGERNKNARLNWDAVKEIRAGGMSDGRFARKFDVSAATVRLARLRITWNHETAA